MDLGSESDDQRLKVGTKDDDEMSLKMGLKTLTTKDLKLARNHQKWHWKASPAENAKIPIRGGLYLLWLL